MYLFDSHIKDENGSLFPNVNAKFYSCLSIRVRLKGALTDLLAGDGGHNLKVIGTKGKEKHISKNFK